MVERYSIPADMKHGNKHVYTYILMLYFLLAPFEDILSFSGGTLGKWLAAFTVIAGLWETRGHIRIKFKDGNFCLICLMLLSALSCIWAIYPDVALARNAAYLMLPAFCLLVSVLDFSEKEYEQIVRAAVLGGVVVAIYILLNGYVGSSGRVRLDEGNDPNNLAALLQLPMAMAFRQTTQKHTKGRVVYVLSLLLIIFVLLLTGSRGGMISAAVFFLAFFLFSKAYRKAGVLFSLLLVAVLIWQIILPALPENILNRLFETNYNKEIVSGNRVRIWKAVVLGLFPQMPAYGIGAGCAPYALMQWHSSGKAVHNTYLCIICEYGLLGIGPFLWLLFAKLKKQLVLNHYSEAALLLCIYATIFFLDAYAKKFFWNVLLLATIAANAAEQEEHKSSPVVLHECYRKERVR